MDMLCSMMHLIFGTAARPPFCWPLLQPTCQRPKLWTRGQDYFQHHFILHPTTKVHWNYSITAFQDELKSNVWLEKSWVMYCETPVEPQLQVAFYVWFFSIRALPVLIRIENPRVQHDFLSCPRSSLSWTQPPYPNALFLSISCTALHHTPRESLLEPTAEEFDARKHDCTPWKLPLPAISILSNQLKVSKSTQEIPRSSSLGFKSHEGPKSPGPEKNHSQFYWKPGSVPSHTHFLTMEILRHRHAAVAALVHACKGDIRWAQESLPGTMSI